LRENSFTVRWRTGIGITTTCDKFASVIAGIAVGMGALRSSVILVGVVRLNALLLLWLNLLILVLILVLLLVMILELIMVLMLMLMMLMLLLALLMWVLVLVLVLVLWWTVAAIA
jgi:hypothetical protein